MSWSMFLVLFFYMSCVIVDRMTLYENVHVCIFEWCIQYNAIKKLTLFPPYTLQVQCTDLKIFFHRNKVYHIFTEIK